MDCTVTLLQERFKKNDKQVYVSAGFDRNEVFAKVKSVTRSEFFGGGHAGLKPALVFSVFFADYNGETLLAYDGETYAVYRTFDDSGSDYIELYAERKVGDLGKNRQH